MLLKGTYKWDKTFSKKGETDVWPNKPKVPNLIDKIKIWIEVLENHVKTD